MRGQGLPQLAHQGVEPIRQGVRDFDLFGTLSGRILGLHESTLVLSLSGFLQVDAEGFGQLACCITAAAGQGASELQAVWPEAANGGQAMADVHHRGRHAFFGGR